MNLTVVLVDIIDEIVSKIIVPNVTFINFEPGTENQILKSLNDLDNSVTSKGKKYPIFAMVMPVKEYHNTGYYAECRIGRIVIGTISNNTDDVFTRYKTGGTFKDILYPIYAEFMVQLSRHPNIVGADPDNFKHVKFDNPGSREVGTGTSDYLDSIEILDLEIILNQLKTC